MNVTKVNQPGHIALSDDEATLRIYLHYYVSIINNRMLRTAIMPTWMRSTDQRVRS